MSGIGPDAMHRAMGTHKWTEPQPWGPSGWMMMAKNGDGIVIATLAPAPGRPDDEEWLHASISRKATMPTYGDLVKLHKAVFGDGYAYQVFAPPSDHVNIHERALHLWGRADGAALLPDFGMYGTI